MLRARVDQPIEWSAALLDDAAGSGKVFSIVR